MNTTDTDIEIDIDDVHDLVTSDLNGDKIESLLYKAGLDTQHFSDEDGISRLEIQGDSVTVVMSETWESDGRWFIDPKTIVLDKLVQDQITETKFPEVKTEEELVEYIENLFDE